MGEHATQYCSSERPEAPECVNKAEFGDRCSDNEECVSNRCKFTWRKRGYTCARGRNPKPSQDRPPTDKIPCGRDAMCDRYAEFCFAGRVGGMFTAKCVPKGEKGSWCMGDHQCVSEHCSFRWRKM